MRCPSCGHDEDRVVDSRVAEEGRAIRRRRECEVCNQRFTTFERVENAPLLVAKRSGEKQTFDREKLISGVRKACKNRPVLPEAMERVADDIVETLRLEGRSVVSTADPGRDVRSAVDVVLAPGERCRIPTGVAVAIPDGHAGFVQPRSGLAARTGLGFVNSPGLIDSGYRGEIQVVAINLDRRDPIDIRRG